MREQTSVTVVADYKAGSIGVLSVVNVSTLADATSIYPLLK